MVLVEHDPVGVHLAVQQFLQKVTVSLEEDASACALAAVLPELVADCLAAGLAMELCRELCERECRNTAGLQYDDAPLAVLA